MFILTFGSINRQIFRQWLFLSNYIFDAQFLMRKKKHINWVYYWWDSIVLCDKSPIPCSLLLSGHRKWPGISGGVHRILNHQFLSYLQRTKSRIFTKWTGFDYPKSFNAPLPRHRTILNVCIAYNSKLQTKKPVFFYWSVWALCVIFRRIQSKCQESYRLCNRIENTMKMLQNIILCADTQLPIESVSVKWLWWEWGGCMLFRSSSICV